MMEQIRKKVKNTIIKEQDNNKLVLILHQSLSIFKLGANIDNYLHMNHVCIPKDDIYVFSVTYVFLDYEVSLSVDEKTEEIVYGIRTDRHCIYQGKELIGMFYNDFANLVKIFPDDVDHLYSYGPHPKVNGRNYDVYTYDSLGLMLWVWRGRIRTINIFSDEYMND